MMAGQGRLARLRAAMEEAGIDVAAIVPGANLYFLTGAHLALMERPTVLLVPREGPLQAIVSYSGFTTAPLGHGAVIHPGAAALGGLVLAYLVLGEPLTGARIMGVAAIILGLVVLAGEAVTAIRGNALTGDLLFATAGFMWAAFTICRRTSWIL